MRKRNLSLSWLTAGLIPIPAAAQQVATSYQLPDNQVLRWTGVTLAVALIWFVLYKVIYPFFLRYYRDEFCKTIFWNLFLLYALTWFFVSSYVFLDFGFYYGWMPWVAVFLCAWWLISGVVLLLRRSLA